MKDLRYGNIKKVVGIQYLNNAVYYNNGQFINQIERLKKQKKNSARQRQEQINKNSKKYRSEDVKLIYFMEYCKVRNKRIYNQLNSNTNLKYKKNTKPNDFKINRMLNAYNKSRCEIIDFAKERKKRELELSKKSSITKKINSNQNTSKTVKKLNTQVTKEKEMKQFKDSIKVKPQEISKLDKAVIEFEKALKERKKYEEELRRKGGREI